MPVSSRTPEGDSNYCPICGNSIRIEPSTTPTRDAPCPYCGHLLSFMADSEEITALVPSLRLGRRRRLLSFLSAGRRKFGTVPDHLIRPLLQAEGTLIALGRARNAGDIEFILSSVTNWQELVCQLERIAQLPTSNKMLATRMFVRRQLRRLLSVRKHKKSIHDAG